MRFDKTHKLRFVLIAIMVSLLILGVKPLIYNAHANSLPNRRVDLSQTFINQTSIYKFTFDITTTNSVGSIKFMFCSDSPLLSEPCTPPVGLDVSSAVLANQTGETGFTILNSASSNQIIITRTASATVPGTVSYEFDGIVNPSSIGSYYARIQTYSSADASGAYIDGGGLAFSMNIDTRVKATVPPFLLFCNGITITDFDCSTASGDFINFGELSFTTARTGSTQMVAATNADNGYGIWVDGQTMTSGNNVIPAISSNDVSRPGTSQFGINLRANSNPSVGSDVTGSGIGAVTANYNTPNIFRFVPNEEIVHSANEDDYRKYTVSYLVNISKAQPPGYYVSTLTYVAIANF